MSKNKINLIKS